MMIVVSVESIGWTGVGGALDGSVGRAEEGDMWIDRLSLRWWSCRGYR